MDKKTKAKNDLLMGTLRMLYAQRDNLLHTHDIGPLPYYMEEERSRQLERIDNEIARLERDIDWPVKIRIS